MSESIEALRAKLIELFNQRCVFDKCHESFGESFGKSKEENMNYMLARINGLTEDELKIAIGKFLDPDYDVEDVIDKSKEMGSKLRKIMKDLEDEMSETEGDKKEEIRSTIYEFINKFAKKYPGMGTEIQGVHSALPFTFTFNIEWLDAKKWMEMLCKTDGNDNDSPVH